MASFNYAAAHVSALSSRDLFQISSSYPLKREQGADMVELDVQLSKDMVPVIYHDYFVNIAMKKVIIGIVVLLSYSSVSSSSHTLPDKL